MAIFGLYSVLTLKRPAIHGLSFAGFTFGWVLRVVPRPNYRERGARLPMQLNTSNLLMLFYVAALHWWRICASIAACN